MTEPAPNAPRLFVAVWPADHIRVRLARIVDELRQGHEGVNWRPPQTWHVTLAFLGSVTADPAELVRALGEVELAPTQATIGPEVQLLGRTVLCVPVQGLDEMAAAVREVAFPFAEAAETRPFFGHVTLARLAGRRHGQRRRGGLAFAQQWVGTPVSAGWKVDELSLVSSTPTSTGHVYNEEWNRSLHPGGWVGRWQERTGLDRPPGT